MKMANTIITIPIPSINPVSRIVASVAPATPKNFFPTELITAFKFGDSNRAWPNPFMIKHTIMNTMVVLSVKNVSSKKPKNITDTPIEVSVRGSILSESLPTNGAQIVMTADWDTKIKPAIWGEYPLVYCRNKLKRKRSAKIEQ